MKFNRVLHEIECSVPRHDSYNEKHTYDGYSYQIEDILLEKCFLYSFLIVVL